MESNSEVQNLKAKYLALYRDFMYLTRMMMPNDVPMPLTIKLRKNEAMQTPQHLNPVSNLYPSKGSYEPMANKALFTDYKYTPVSSLSAVKGRALKLCFHSENHYNIYFPMVKYIL